MLSPKEQLERLLRIQDLAEEAREARAVIDGAPARIEEIEGRFRERNAEYVAVKERNDLLEAEQRLASGELQMLEESRKKYMDSLMQVKNQREYAAVLKEIDTVKAQISQNEEIVLKAMEELETLKSDLEARSSHIQEERKLVEAETARVAADIAGAEERTRLAEEERRRIETELPRDLVSGIRRVEESRQGLFVAKAEGQICQSCFVKIRPQVYQEIRLASRIHTCSSCRRYLVYEPALRSAPPRPASAEEASSAGAPDGAV